MNLTPLGVYQHIALELRDIRPSKTNPRKHFDQVGLDELTESIRTVGVLTPVTIRPIHFEEHARTTEENYEIVSGERRYRAAKAAGLVHIPVIIAELSDEDAEIVQMVENLQRADLHPLEEADGYWQLYRSGNMTVEDVAKQTGKTVIHVGRAMKLVNLELAARRLFLANHITLGHALILARLTFADQDRAMRNMLNASGDYAKMSTLKVIEAREKNIATNTYAKHRRLIETTEGQLRQWISENVLLQLGKAPWSLEDGLLVPEAGACTTCPKRTGSNPALFEDLTVDADVCLDAACFATKHKAFTALTIKAANDAGESVVRLTAKSGHQPLGVLKPATKIAHGQWMEAKPGSCKSVTKGVLVDEAPRYAEIKAKPGEILTVCADQACKVHKHHVDKPSPRPIGSIQASSSKGKTADQLKAEAEARQAALREFETREMALRVEIFREMQEANYSGLVRNAVIILMENVEGDLDWAASQLGVIIPKAANHFQQNEKAEEVLAEYIRTAPIPKLDWIVLILLTGEAMRMEEWDGAPDSVDSRKHMWELAKMVGVDADAIAEEMEKQQDAVDAAKALSAAIIPAAAASAKPALKKSAKKYALTPESREKIKKAMAKRWADARKKPAAKPDRKSAAAGERD